MAADEEEEGLLRSVALQNASSIQLARVRAERELLHAKESLEIRSQELAESLALMRATLESTTNGILAIAENRTVTTFNRRFVDLWRITEDFSDLERVRAEMAVQITDPEGWRQRLEEIDATRPADSSDVIELCDGRVYERFSKLQMIGDRVVGRVWSFGDITERRRAEQRMQSELAERMAAQEALRLSGERFRFMAEVMPQKIFTAQPSGKVDYVNEQFTRYTALGVGEMNDAAWATVIHPDDLAEFTKSWRVSVATGDGLELEHRLRDGNGGYRWHLSRARAMRDDLGQVQMWIGSSTDIDELKRVAQERTALLESERAARGESERTSRMKDEFLATLSHELRTPLNAILGWSQILARPGSDPASLQQGLSTIERNARIQTQLIDDLLDMSRIISGKIRLDVQPADPIAFIDAAIQAVTPAAQAKGVRLEEMLDPKAGPLSGDPSRLQQVIWNLLSNAIKFTPKGGKVQVLLERVSSHIEISVADDGIGMEPEFLPHVFERFRQADATSTRKFGGLGLGLSIVKQLVELHGGTVRVKSLGLDRGTTFIVALPLTAARRYHRRQRARGAVARGAGRNDEP